MKFFPNVKNVHTFLVFVHINKYFANSQHIDIIYLSILWHQKYVR